jgi:hypothetical protein
MSTHQQSPQANTRTAIEVSPQITDVDVVMAKADKDNNGFDVFGSIFKVYPKPKPARKHMVRYNIKLSVTPCEATKALTELSKVLVSIWTVLRNADKKLVIYPWKDGSPFAPLQKIKDMPTLLSDIGHYFNRAFPRKVGGTAYISMYLGHEKSFQTYKRNWHGGLATKDLAGT